MMELKNTNDLEKNKCHKLVKQGKYQEVIDIFLSDSSSNLGKVRTTMRQQESNACWKKAHGDKLK